MSSICASVCPLFFSSRRRHTICLSDWSSDVSLPIAQFHSNIDGVGDHLDLVAMAQAAAHMGGGCAGGKPNTLVGIDKLCRGQTDAPLLFGEALLAGQERTVVTEWLVKQRFLQRGAALGAAGKGPA